MNLNMFECATIFRNVLRRLRTKQNRTRNYMNFKPHGGGRYLKNFIMVNSSYTVGIHFVSNAPTKTDSELYWIL